MIIGLVLILLALLMACIVFRRVVQVEDDLEQQAAFAKGPKPVLGKLTESFAWSIPVSNDGKRKLKTELVQAGFYHERSLINFLAARNVSLMAWSLIVAILLAFGALDGLGWKGIGIPLAAAALIYGLPRLLLSSRANQRSIRIQNDLPDALDMMTMMMAGGLTMEHSLNRVIGEFESTHPALATELSIVARQSEAGSFNDALMSFANRLALPDVTTLTTLMRQSNRLGGKIVDALREYADTMRRIRQQKAEENGNKASIKLLLPVILCLAPPIYILLLGPAVLELRDFVARENRPGGVLAPTVEQQRQQQNITRAAPSSLEYRRF